jgi:hypothetical protein
MTAQVTHYVWPCRRSTTCSRNCTYRHCLGGDLEFSGNEIRAVRSNDDIVFKPAGTGAISMPAIRFNGNNIEGTRSNEDIRLLPAGTGSVVFGSLSISGTSLSSDDSTAININDNLTVDGTATISGTATITGATTLNAASGSSVGTLTLADGSITDSSGNISFGNENITTTGTITAATGSQIGNLTLQSTLDVTWATNTEHTRRDWHTLRWRAPRQ